MRLNEKLRFLVGNLQTLPYLTKLMNYPIISKLNYSCAIAVQKNKLV